MAEWLKGGDYFNFIIIVESELKGYFGNVQVLNVSKSSAWLCSCFVNIYFLVAIFNGRSINTQSIL